MRELTYVDALREAVDQSMEADANVIVFGLDVDDHKAIQGSTRGLVEKYGPERVFTTPLSEDAMTGAAIGAAMNGLRPIHVHIRMDFMMLAMNQLINIAAKARYMYGGQVKVPLVVRCMIGKSWGQGAQHSQGLYSMFMNVPGLKVCAPSTAYHAKGCMQAAIADDNPVIMVEHRLLYGTKSLVPEEPYKCDAYVGSHMPYYADEAGDITIVAISNAVNTAVEAAKLLKSVGVSADVIDPVWLKPLYLDVIMGSVINSRRLLVIDNGWETCGAGAEIIAACATQWTTLQHTPTMYGRMGYAEAPCPTAPNLEREFYPTPESIAAKAWRMVHPGMSCPSFEKVKLAHEEAFTGPF